MIPQFAKDLLHHKVGPLTRELLREPGGFGLGQVPTSKKPDATTTSTCGYCSTGCGLEIHLKDGEAVSLTPKTEYPVNLGMACPKGWEALTVLESDERATTPLLRNEQGKMKPVDWETAATTFVDKFKAIQEKHGKDSVAFLSTGQLPTEEMGFLGALAKFGMGLLHGDGNTRQCMATAVVAYKQSFGFDAPPYTYKDYEESDVLVFIGANPCIAHPIMWERVMRNQNDPKIIVIDPRMTETAMQSSLHMPIAPKSDMDLLYGISKILIDNNWIDREYIDAHTNDFDDYASYVQSYSLETVSEKTGISEDDIMEFARMIAGGEKVSFWWTMGVNQSYQGVRTAQAIINLQLMTGNFGRPGTGANSITGQCNAMGSRLFSNTTNLLGGHDFTNEEDRKKIAQLLEIDVSLIPTKNSWAYNEIMEGVLSGKIKGLWVICTNPAHSWINQNMCNDVLERLDFLVVQDMYSTTETAQKADLILPAAGWGEKEGTFINSERRFGTIKKVKKAPGQALSDFSIFKLIAHYWGCEEMFKDWSTPEAVFQIMKKISKGQPCDITGIENYAMLDELGGIQWPCAEEGRGYADRESLSHFNERYLFEDGQFYHEDGKAKFIFEDPKPLSEPPTEKFPFMLLTGRGTASQWHTQTRTKNSAVLRKLYPNDPFVEINPKDARESGIGQSDWVIVSSQRGEMKAIAFVTNAVQPGQIFIPMHYEETNKLTDSVFDPYSKQPSYKLCAAAVARMGVS